jgi:hypothetical protein
MRLTWFDVLYIDGNQARPSSLLTPVQGKSSAL